MAAAKTGVDAALFNGREPVLTSDIADDGKEGIGLVTGSDAGDATSVTDTTKIRSNLISKLELKNNTATNVEIEATLGNKANKDIHTAVVSQNRSTDGVWTCAVVTGQATGFKTKFIPTGCKNSK